MSHTIREKNKLLSRIKRIKGQAEAIEKALIDEKGCNEVLHQIAGMRGAINGLMIEVIEEHVHTHIVHADIDNEENRQLGADELVEVLRTYIK